tara:strand:- start:475 stop:1167 length:693 start_codon:yes stop_codon:yes gene_type:complete
MIFQILKAGMVSASQSDAWVQQVVHTLEEMVAGTSGEAMFGLRELLSLPSSVMSDASKQNVYEDAKQTYVPSLYILSFRALINSLLRLLSRLFRWTTCPFGIEQFITFVCTSDSDFTLSLISRLVAEPFFKFSHTSHARSVGRGWAMNRKRSLLTEQGLRFTVDMCVSVGQVSDLSAFCFVDAFNDIHRLAPEHKEKIHNAIVEIMGRIDGKQRQALYGKLAMLINGGCS